MRLQLIIQRHGLPPTHVLWNVTNSGDNHTAGTRTTISQFLEQVNGIIPLESGDWGLEDYAVEVAGFECLHFSELESVLRDEDEVNIRPLQTSDIRVRKLTGRHQISSDGKHLIDGVAFGRPYLRRADRPAIRIPPRKRRRLTYDEDTNEVEYGEGDELDRQLLLSTGDEDTDHEVEGSDDDFNEGGRQMLPAPSSTGVESEDDEDDADFHPSEMADELKGLQEEDIPSEPQGSSPWKDAVKRDRYSTRLRTRGTGLILEDGHILELVDDDGHPYPGEYNNALLDYFERSEDDALKTMPASDVRNSTTASKQKPNKSKPTHLRSLSRSARSSLKSRSPKDKTVRFGTVTSKDHREEVGSMGEGEDDEEDDEDFRPEDGMDIDEIDEISSAGSADSKILSISASSSSPSSTSLSSSTSEDESAESAPEEVSSRPKAQQERKRGEAEIGSTRPESPREQSSSQDIPRPIQSSPPGEGLQATRKRNQRRRQSKRLAYLKKIGVLDPQATLQDLEKYRAGNYSTVIQTPSNEQIEAPTEISKGPEGFQAKRKELLASLASGGIEIGDSETWIEKEHEADPASAKDSANILHHYSSKDTEDIITSTSAKSTAIDNLRSEPKTADTPMTITETAVIETASEPPRRRNKLDIASSRRLLFGSLGVRTPKTKDDEQKLRDDFMKHVRLPATQKRSPAHIKFDDAGEAAPADVSVGDVKNAHKQNGYDDSSKAAKEQPDEGWKSKISLSAVECCHEGVKLSTPPFPFIQRWDPQQQAGSLSGKARSKAKKRKRNEAKYYEDDEQYYDGQNAMNVEYAEPEADVELTYDEPVETLRSEDAKRQDSDEVNAAVNEQIMRDADGLSASATHVNCDEEELVALPENLSSRPPIVESEIQVGCILAFKQLDMSEETKWQPKISDYRTARVDNILKDGTLQVMLARRDRRIREMMFDDETGDRIYGKFEMPGYDGDDPPEDDGFLEVTLGELIEPKLLQAAAPSSGAQSGEAHESFSRGSGAIGGAQGVASTGIRNVSEQANGGTEDVASPVTEEAKRPVSVSDSARTEITKMIKDAGFRSSLGSVVDESLDQLAENEEAGGSSDYSFAGGSRSGPSTPRFNGFGSSPPPSGLSMQESSPQNTTTSIPKTQFTGDTRQKPSFGKKASQQAEEPTNLYPELPVMSSQQSAGFLHADDSMDDGPRFGSGGNDSEIASQSSEDLIENTQPNDNPTGSLVWTSSPLQPATSTKILSPNVNSDEPEPLLGRAFQTLGFESEEIEDDVLLTTFEILSAEMSSDNSDFKQALHIIAKSRQSKTLLAYLQQLNTESSNANNNQEASSPTIHSLPSIEEKNSVLRSHAGPSSDTEFPPLETVISSARTSFESIKEEEDRKSSAQPQSRSEIRRQLHSVPDYRAFSTDNVLFLDEEEDEHTHIPHKEKYIEPKSEEEENTPKASQQHVQTQASYVIDLTQSSDPVTGAVENEDMDKNISNNELSLPSGPGWVSKWKKASEGVSANKRVKRVGRRGGSV
ncbi:MAG: hypothetical protein M1812_003564 [Candelaria pacifica]|nr:MAG: hypothetical protein M1812_003564 [Candelaria pacifica]